MEKKLIAKSRFISLVLRHNPEAIGLRLDVNGWADRDELLVKAAAHGCPISAQELNLIVLTNDKKRFELDHGGNRIRASQGHSIPVDLELSASTPPPVLFHGTGEQNRTSILGIGLVRGARNHVHLSGDPITATQVGSRHGKCIIFQVAAGDMHADGIPFFLSKNGVWLTEQVPAAYLTHLK